MDEKMEKIILRTLQLHDAERMLEWMLDSSIYSKMQYDYRELSLDKCILFIKNSWREKENLHFAISNAQDEYMGTISLKNIDDKNKRAELGIVVHPSYMGRGIASKALYELVKKAFWELGLNKIYLYVRCDNERAVGFYRKNQMEFEGCAKEHLFIDGEYKDIFWFALRKKNYNSWKNNLIRQKELLV